MNLPTAALRYTDSPLYSGHCHPPQPQGSSFSGSVVVLALEILHIYGTISCEYPWEDIPDLYIHKDPEEVEKEEQAAVEKVVSKEEFQDEWTIPAPEFTATHAKLTGWSESI